MKILRIINREEVKTGDIVLRRGKRYVVTGFTGKNDTLWITATSACERKYFVRFTPEEIACVIGEVA
jgi:hypothetical protein